MKLPMNIKTFVQDAGAGHETMRQQCSNEPSDELELTKMIAGF
jgi:hypothetical protein